MYISGQFGYVCHPLSFEMVYTALRVSISTVLQSLRDKVGQTLEVEMTDLRDRFNIYEIVGPKSSQVVAGVLSPIKDELKDDFKKVFRTYYINSSCDSK